MSTSKERQGSVCKDAKKNSGQKKLIPGASIVILLLAIISFTSGCAEDDTDPVNTVKAIGDITITKANEVYGITDMDPNKQLVDFYKTMEDQMGSEKSLFIDLYELEYKTACIKNVTANNTVPLSYENPGEFDDYVYDSNCAVVNLLNSYLSGSVADSALSDFCEDDGVLSVLQDLKDRGVSKDPFKDFVVTRSGYFEGHEEVRLVSTSMRTEDGLFCDMDVAYEQVTDENGDSVWKPVKVTDFRVRGPGGEIDEYDYMGYAPYGNEDKYYHLWLKKDCSYPLLELFLDDLSPDNPIDLEAIQDKIYALDIIETDSKASAFGRTEAVKIKSKNLGEIGVSGKWKGKQFESYLALPVKEGGSYWYYSTYDADGNLICLTASSPKQGYTCYASRDSDRNVCYGLSLNQRSAFIEYSDGNNLVKGKTWAADGVPDKARYLKP